MLARNGLSGEEVAGWAVHPGGPRILDVVGDRLGLPDGALDTSAEVLREYGNCSSATVLLVLERLAEVRAFAPGETVVLLAFGPGLTLYSVLLRYNRLTSRRLARLPLHDRHRLVVAMATKNRCRSWNVGLSRTWW